MLHAIESLKSLRSNLSDPLKIREIDSQINELSLQLESVSSGFSLNSELDKLKLENKKLKDEVLKLRKELSFSRSGQQKLNSSVEESVFVLYHVLLEKYSDLINDFEKKTVGELKGLVNPNDLSIVSLVESFKPEGFVFEKDFFNSAKLAFEFVRDEIDFVKSKVNINFWLSPSEILKFRIGDDEDQAVFLCSLLLALGDKNAEVIIAELSDFSTHAFVLTEINNKFFLLDPSQNHEFTEFSGLKKNVLKKYSFNNAGIKNFLYRFNNEKYEQFI